MDIVVHGVPSDSEREELGRSLESLKRLQAEQRAKNAQADNRAELGGNGRPVSNVGCCGNEGRGVGEHSVEVPEYTICADETMEENSRRWKGEIGNRAARSRDFYSHVSNFYSFLLGGEIDAAEYFLGISLDFYNKHGEHVSGNARRLLISMQKDTVKYRRLEDDG